MDSLTVAPPALNRKSNSNNVLEKDRAIHEWYRFVLAFPPHLVREFFERCSAKKNAVFVDPFCGTGTALVEAKKAGMKTIGIDANPVACLASRVKTNWALNPDALERALEHIEKQVPSLAKWIAGDGTDKTLFELGEIHEDVILSTSEGAGGLESEAAQLLPKRYISPRPLQKVLELRRAIEQVPEGDRRDFFLLALACVIVKEASNVAFGPEIYLGKIRHDAPVFEAFAIRARQMLRELRAIQATFDQAPETLIRQGDARTIFGERQFHQAVDLLFTSPPYPNEKDYTRTTRLELVLLGFLKSKQDLRSLKEGLLRSNTRNVFHDDNDAAAVTQFRRIGDIASAIEKRRVELQKTSGFERLYHRVVLEYFGGMHRHLQHVYRTLRRGGHGGYVVGDQMSYLMVHIPTGDILEELAESVGFRIVDRFAWRERWATASKKRLLEEVVWFRKP